MINSINKINLNNKVNFSTIEKKRNTQSSNINSIPKDTVSFKGKTRIVESDILKLIQKLEKNSPVIGFKGDGIWVLPNLRTIAGERFNLYLPDGKQISYQKGQAKDNVIFSLKTNFGQEKTQSKIKLPERDECQKNKKLVKTKTDHVLTFRINTKDSNKLNNQYNAGEISKIYVNSDGTLSETYDINDDEFQKINEVLNKYLKKFF